MHKETRVLAKAMYILGNNAMHILGKRAKYVLARKQCLSWQESNVCLSKKAMYVLASVVMYVLAKKHYISGIRLHGKRTEKKKNKHTHILDSK